MAAALAAPALAAQTGGAPSRPPATPAGPPAGRLAAAQPPAAGTAQPAGTGRVAGRVVDAGTGQPLTGAQVGVDGRPSGGVTDLDGRYRVGGLPAGTYTLRVRRLGYVPKLVERVVVRADAATVVDVALANAPSQLAAVRVVADRQRTPTSEAGLLAIQQKAAGASDGVSAEQIARSPDAGANDAARRVSGVSVFDDKYVVVRGLGERYSNTLLNGVEIASPEPTRRIVPLDIFPASLLDALVVSKTATPDKPGDFSGGSVEIRTKDFPDNTIAQLSVSGGYNSRSTFVSAEVPRRLGSDWLAFDAGRRALPRGFPSVTDVFPERFAESVRNVWNPGATRTPPNVGVVATAGGQTTLFRQPFGGVAAVTYSTATDVNPDHFLQYYSDPAADPQRGFTNTETRAAVDVSALLNLSYRPGRATKLALRNTYTRGAEDWYVVARGFDTDRNGDVLGYQRQYVARELVQTQLAGEHLLARLGNTRAEWKASVSRARRDEPENRVIEYQRPPASDRYLFSVSAHPDFFYRFLVDRIATAQTDWSVPLRTWGGREGTVKVGGLVRRKSRDFTGRLLTYLARPGTTMPTEVAALPPDQLFSPEVIGQYLVLATTGAGERLVEYSVDDDVGAGYAMVDVPVLSRVRVVAGARYEDWRVDLRAGSKAALEADTLLLVRRNNGDLLPSVNATLALTGRMNLRLAAFRSVARPDTRELSPDTYTERIGEPSARGNPNLKRTRIANLDARWEWYPRAGEVLAVSAYRKRMTLPIINIASTDNGLSFTFDNARTGLVTGAEAEVRRGLDFLPGPLARLGAVVNYTYAKTSATFDSASGLRLRDKLPLVGQSPHLVNGSLVYTAPKQRLTASVLYNWFDTRIVRYGVPGGGGQSQAPNIVEQARGSLDAKLQVGLGRGLTLTTSGRNLGDARVVFTQETAGGRRDVGNSRVGRTITVGVGYAR